MRFSTSVKSKLHIFCSRTIYYIFGVILILTLISFRLVCGMLARYTSSGNKDEGARVACAGQVDILEHEAYFDSNTYTYQLRTEKLVTENTYDVVVPGMEIEKDPIIRLYGNNEVSYYLYIEVKSSDDAKMNYDISEEWSQTNDIYSAHGGKVYKFQSVIEPGEKRDIHCLFKDNVIRISEDLKNKAAPTENVESFKIEIYAYIVQVD